ncbi:PilZ domain-containing protein [Hyphococcus luteus]|nr:PilZ domain-containing protein [Marinicaulis flavus]
MAGEKAPRAGPERRRFPRKLLDGPVRFATENEPDAIGRIVSISECGLYMLCRTHAQVGDPVIAYPERLGRLAGEVSRKDENGVAIEFSMTEAKRAFLAKQLNADSAAPPFLRIMERRSALRTKLDLEAAAVVEGEDEPFPCRIIDLSETGAGVEAGCVPPIGARVRIGILHGVVARHTRGGFALAFSDSELK